MNISPSPDYRIRILDNLCRHLSPRHIFLAGLRDPALLSMLVNAATKSGATLHIAARHVPSWVQAIRTQAGERCILHHAPPIDVAGVIPVPDIAWLDDDPNWYSVHRLLEALLAQSTKLAKPFPLAMIAGTGWPNARRDSYDDPESIPAAYRQRHERAGLIPGRKAPGTGLFADTFHSVSENEPNVGVLTAVEDFIAGRADQFRLTLLPGFGGLAALTARTGAAATAFEPAAVARTLTDIAAALEQVRLDQAIKLAERDSAPTQQSPSPAALKLPAPEGPWEGPQAEPGEEAEALARLWATPIFDAAWYLTRYGDVAAAKIDPALHYLRTGVAEQRDPGPSFSTSYYLSNSADVAEQKLNPLLHYLAHGAAEGRNPSAQFATRHYVDAHPEVAEQGHNPLEHFLTTGRAAGWRAPPVSG
jgi:hypothetical protein